MPKRSGSSAHGERAAASVRVHVEELTSRSPELVAGAAGGHAPRGPASDREGTPSVDRHSRRSEYPSFRNEPRRRRVGCQTLINEVLAEHARKDVP
jgi:hypothetical protein